MKLKTSLSFKIKSKPTLCPHQLDYASHTVSSQYSSICQLCQLPNFVAPLDFDQTNARNPLHGRIKAQHIP